MGKNNPVAAEAAPNGTPIHGRGALGVLMAADQLKKKGIVIYALVLFDAGRRHIRAGPGRCILLGRTDGRGALGVR